MKILVVPMHASIGVAAIAHLEEKEYDRVIMVHPWSKEGSENANAEHLRKHFRRRLLDIRLEEKQSYDIPKIEVIAMDCSQKPLEIATNFEYLIKRDADEYSKNDVMPNFITWVGKMTVGELRQGRTCREGGKGQYKMNKHYNHH